MNIWQMLLALLILSLIAYRAAMTLFRTSAARKEMSEERPFRNITTDYRKTMLVVGDSTGAGVGASSPEESIAGRLASYIGATYVENYAASGAEVKSLPQQIQQATRDRYDLVLVQIGGHDIMLFHDARTVSKELDIILSTLPDSGQTLLMSVGNMGGAKTFPLFIRPFHSFTTMAYHRWFKKVALRRRITYVNLYLKRSEDFFLDDPKRYFSPDGMHPSSDGYALWFEKVKEAVDEKIKA